MEVRIDPTWKQVLQQEFDKPYFELLTLFVKQEYRLHQIFPPARLIFNAFDSCPFDKVKVVILGQDPYHDFGQAHGLCFSVNDGVAVPPSLQNIYKELNTDLGVPVPQSGNLQRWADQGVLLLNATLTVEAHRREVIRTKDGKYSPMPSYKSSPLSVNILSLCYGVVMRKEKGRSSRPKSIWYSKPPIPHRCPLTKDSLVVAISPRRISISNRTA